MALYIFISSLYVTDKKEGEGGYWNKNGVPVRYGIWKENKQTTMSTLQAKTPHIKVKPLGTIH